MAEQYTNIRLILDNILEHPLLQDVTFEQAVKHTVNFMRLVGTPSIFIEKSEMLYIENYRALLPCDYGEVIQVRKIETTGDSIAFRYTTDTFHMSDNKPELEALTYKIQGNVIYTSLQTGDIEMTYKSIATDNDGYPLIPDNSSFTRALEFYIKKYYFTILFDMGKIAPAVLQNVQQEYAWAVGDCQSEFNRLSIDKAESFYNSWSTLVARATAHDTGFRYNGTQEKIRVH